MTEHCTEGLAGVVEKFQHAAILVIGDVMLDKFIWGETTRLSPEAPVPVVHIKNETCAPGGAGNAAMNVAALGAKCFVLGLVGEDSAKDVLTTLLRAKNINTDGLMVHNKPTIQKIRVMGNSHQLLRLDYEEKTENPKEQEMIDYASKIIQDIDVILVSDYAKGMITETLMSELKKLGKKIIVDPKGDRFHYYKGAYAIKPNDKEASEITKIKDCGEDSINQMGGQLLERSGANIVLSRGKEGMSVFETSGAISHLPAQAKEAHDVTGAGDTVVAALAIATAVGANLQEASTLANYAAGIKVAKIGTVAVTNSELQNSLKQGIAKLKTKEEILKIANDLRKNNKKIVFTNGCFDILHIGHTRLLQQAKMNGDVLILALDTDDSVMRLKGEGRPVLPQQQRAEILSALDCVDYILFFEHSELNDLLAELQPELFARGAQALKEENEVVESYGGKIVLVNVVPDVSSTIIMEKVKKSQ